MGFSFLPTAPVVARDHDLKGLSPEFLASQGCRVCTLVKAPKVAPGGADEPYVYMLGEAPGETEVDEGEPFVGNSGQLLRGAIPRDLQGAVRYNNAILSHPPGNRDPTALEMGCCRPFVVEDIEATRPAAVFGFGNIALEFATGDTGIGRWAGRYCPVRIGNHTTWFFAHMHPAWVLRAERGTYIPGEKGVRPDSNARPLFMRGMANAFKILETLPEPVVHDAAMARAEVHIELTDANRVIRFLDQASTQPEAGFDYETRHTRPYYADSALLTVAVSLRSDTGNETTLAFPLDHPQATWSARDRKRIGEALHRFVLSPCRKLVHNVSFEVEWSTVMFDDVKAARMGSWGCSQSLAFILDARTRTHNLDFLCHQYFGIALKSLTDLDKEDLASADITDVCRYNGVDAKYHRLLFNMLEPKIEALGLTTVYNHHIERIGALVKTQVRGLHVDTDANAHFADQYSTRAETALAHIHASKEAKAFAAKKGRRFNPGSTKDINDVLVDAHKIVLAKNAGGEEEQSSTTKDILKTVGLSLTDDVILWRHAAKMLATYVKPLTEGSDVLFADGCLHPVISANRVRTWRTSGDDPNTQNWPKYGDGRLLRKQIVPRKGHSFVAVDYSGIQARNVAMESTDATLVDAFIHDYDIHAEWMHRIKALYPRFGNTDDPEQRKELRHRAKNKMVFPLFFGAQAGSIAHYLEVPDHVGFKLYDAFWGMFPDVRQWHTRIKRQYRKHGYVSGLSEFRRWAPITENQLINSPIQADEALIVLSAMVRLSGYEDPNLQPVFEIHDDLTFEIETTKLDEYLDIIICEMLYHAWPWINVPLACEVSISHTNWYDLKEIGKFKSDGHHGYVDAK